MEQPSKSERKRQTTSLQKLGERLVDLSPEQLAAADLPQDLREAVLLARTLKKHGARRRQLQFIGTLMRSVNPETVEKALARAREGRSIDPRIFRQVESWRDELLAGNDALVEELARRLPRTDSARLRDLVTCARAEGRSPKTRQAFRALFRYLRALAADGDTPEISDE